MAVHRPNALKLVKRVVGPWSLNAYALVCPDSLDSVLVDPGAEPDVLHQMLKGTRPKAIVVTHGHPDHIGALGAVRRQLGVPVFAHHSGSNIHGPLVADRWIEDGERITVGNHALRVIHTPGHTDDQICLDIMASPIVLVGDTIFEGGPGRTASAADFRKTKVTLRETVLGWPDETVCYPGHGPSFRLGEKRMAIEQFLHHDHEDFFGDATWEM